MSEAKQPVFVSDQVREVERLHRDLLTDSVRQLPIREQLDRQARVVVAEHQRHDRHAEEGMDQHDVGDGLEQIDRGEVR